MHHLLNLILGLILGVLAIALPGCSSIEMKMPANRFDSPEASGKTFKGHVDPVTIQGANHLTIVNDYTRVPPVTDSPQLSRSEVNYQFGAGMGLIDRLDMDVKIPASGPALIGLKYQLLGDTAAEAKPENISLAVTAAAGYGGDSGDSKQLLGNVASQFTMQEWSFDTAVIAGFRTMPWMLIFGGPFYTTYSVSGDITQPAGGSTNFHFAGIGNQLGLSGGAEFELKHILLKSSVSVAHANYNNANPITSVYGGFLFGIRW